MTGSGNENRCFVHCSSAFSPLFGTLFEAWRFIAQPAATLVFAVRSKQDREGGPAPAAGTTAIAAGLGQATAVAAVAATAAGTTAIAAGLGQATAVAATAAGEELEMLLRHGLQMEEARWTEQQQQQLGAVKEMLADAERRLAALANMQEGPGGL